MGDAATPTASVILGHQQLPHAAQPAGNAAGCSASAELGPYSGRQQPGSTVAAGSMQPEALRVLFTEYNEISGGAGARRAAEPGPSHRRQRGPTLRRGLGSD